jgi:hypothetical protein
MLGLTVVGIWATVYGVRIVDRHRDKTAMREFLEESTWSTRQVCNHLSGMIMWLEGVRDEVPPTPQGAELWGPLDARAIRWKSEDFYPAWQRVTSQMQEVHDITHHSIYDDSNIPSQVAETIRATRDAWTAGNTYVEEARQALERLSGGKK